MKKWLQIRIVFAKVTHRHGQDNNLLLHLFISLSKCPAFAFHKHSSFGKNERLGFQWDSFWFSCWVRSAGCHDVKKPWMSWCWTLYSILSSFRTWVTSVFPLYAANHKVPLHFGSSSHKKSLPEAIAYNYIWGKGSSSQTFICIFTDGLYVLCFRVFYILGRVSHCDDQCFWTTNFLYHVTKACNSAFYCKKIHV